MCGGVGKQKLDENSEFNLKVYAASKLFSHNLTEIYRDSYDLFCASGILFNHESPLKG